MARLPEYQSSAFAALEARERRYAREVAAALKDALDDIRVQMKKLYDKLAVNGELTKAQMTRANRLATAERQLAAIVDPAAQANVATLNRMRPEQYGASFFRQAWAIDSASGLRIEWGRVPVDAMREALASEFYKVSIRRYGREARTVVREALNKGLAQGKGYKAMMADMRDALNTTNARALRILRTEGQTAVNAGAEATYTRAIEEGIEGRIVWDATLDDRTRPAHQTMDGQAQGDDGLFRLPNGETAPHPAWEGLSAGQRINCRCRTRFEIEGYEPQLRRSREQGVLPAQSYSEWEASQGIPTPEEFAASVGGTVVG